MQGMDSSGKVGERRVQVILRVFLSLCTGVVLAGLTALTRPWMLGDLLLLDREGDRWWHRVGPVVLVRRWLHRRMMIRFGRELAENLPLLVRCARSGYVPLELVHAGAREAEGAMVRSTFERVLDRFGVGVSLEEALWKAHDEMPQPLFRRFICALQFARESGGDIAHSLSALAEIVRSRKALQAETREESAEARYSAVLVAVLPVAIAFYVSLVRPGMMAPLLGTSAGRTALTYAVLSWGAGVMYLYWIISTSEGDAL